MKTPSRSGALMCAFFFAQSISLFAQGSLTPPPGPPAPTMKTLDQVEPRTAINDANTPGDANYHFIISQPGSYYLPARLAVTLPNGIHITAAGVTLDLNGFDIARQTGAGGDGITILPGAHRCTIRNGTITGFSFGINTQNSGGFPARGCAFQDLAVSNCAGFGIVAGDGAVVESCRLHDNAGFVAISTGDGSTLINCTVSRNTSTNYGILTGDGCTLTNCVASDNISSVSTSAGIGTGTGCTVTHCTASGNTSTAAASTPTTGMGFDLGASNTIQGCTAASNEGDGINISGDTLVRDNTCDSNGNGGDGAGIHVTSSDNRIDGNNVTDNDRGIDVDVAGNVILRNSASSNVTNYDIVANNVFGAIVDRTAPASAAVTGNAAASSAGTTDPWANFTY